jgi:ribonucleotide reductase alpha subunit
MCNHLQAQKLNKEIFETIYFHALNTSADLAAEEGVYETYPGCPISKVISMLYGVLFVQTSSNYYITRTCI